LQRRAGFALVSMLSVFGPSCVCANNVPAAPAGKSAFFASPGACVASKAFDRTECDGAFGSALQQIGLRDFVFASQFECVARFRFCERVTAGADARRSFRPVLLGIEIVRGPRGCHAKPVFAVETPPELLAPRPQTSVVARTREGRGAATNALTPPRLSLGPPVDHFASVDFLAIKRRWSGFQRDAEISPSVSAATDMQPRETAQQRRERLQNAPFVE
jgi:hypothetical protein